MIVPFRWWPWVWADVAPWRDHQQVRRFARRDPPPEPDRLIDEAPIANDVIRQARELQTLMRGEMWLLDRAAERLRSGNPLADAVIGALPDGERESYRRIVDHYRDFATSDDTEGERGADPG